MAEPNSDTSDTNRFSYLHSSGILAVTGHHPKQSSHVNCNTGRPLVWSFEFRIAAQEPGKGSLESQRLIRVTKALWSQGPALSAALTGGHTLSQGVSGMSSSAIHTDFAFSPRILLPLLPASVVNVPALSGRNFTAPSHHQNSRTGTKERVFWLQWIPSSPLVSHPHTLSYY